MDGLDRLKRGWSTKRRSSSSIIRPAISASFLLTRERKRASQFVQMAISLPRATFSRMSSASSAPIVRRGTVDTTSFRLRSGSGRRRSWRGVVVALAGSKADDSAPFEMSVEHALKLLGVSEGASFDEILRAKKAIVDACNGDQAAIAQVEAAYDMLLMQSLTQRRAGKVVSSGIRYADVKPVKPAGVSTMPQWLQTSMKSAPVSVDSPSTGDLGIQAGVYGALMVLTYANGAATNVGAYSGPDVPGLILATSFGASLYFMTKKNVKLGKATLITVGGLVAGAVVGSVVENWLQVDIVPFLGVHSPAAVVSEFILVSQLLVSLYLR